MIVHIHCKQVSQLIERDAEGSIQTVRSFGLMRVSDDDRTLLSIFCPSNDPLVFSIRDVHSTGLIDENSLRKIKLGEIVTLLAASGHHHAFGCILKPFDHTMIAIIGHINRSILIDEDVARVIELIETIAASIASSDARALCVADSISTDFMPLIVAHVQVALLVHRQTHAVDVVDEDLSSHSVVTRPTDDPSIVAIADDQVSSAVIKNDVGRTVQLIRCVSRSVATGDDPTAMRRAVLPFDDPMVQLIGDEQILIVFNVQRPRIRQLIQSHARVVAAGDDEAALDPSSRRMNIAGTQRR